MAWQDRLREAAYTSPGGTRITFSYEEVSREIERRVATFEFPGINDVYAQDNGFGARKYPMRCFFSGRDHDLVATAFEAALLERGVGRLEHPLYGTFDVIPVGGVTRREDLKAAANQSIVETTFWTTVRAVYPSSSLDPGNEIQRLVEGFNVQAAQQFASTATLSTALDKTYQAATSKTLLKTVSAGLSSIAGTTASVRQSFNDRSAAMNYSMDVLVGQPLLLAQQTLNLIQTPARSSAALASRLLAYRQLAARIMSSATATGSRKNDFITADMSILGAVSGSVLCLQTGGFRTRPEAVNAVDELLGQFDAAVSFRDLRYAGLGVVDTGEAYQSLLAAVATTASVVVDQAFALMAEYRIVLDRPRTIIDLAAEIYQDLSDERLNFLIDTNQLTGSEILELPRGRTITFYA